MSSETRKNVGFPSNQVKGFDFAYSPGCGGYGSTSCVDPSTYSYIYWPIKVNPFSRRNNKLIIRDDKWLPYTDAGPDILCTHSDGSRLPFDVMLMYDAPVSSLDRSLATSIVNIPTTTALPFSIEFSEDQIPQPTDPSYDRKIWVVVDMSTAGVMTGGVQQTAEVMQTVKLDYEATP